MENRSDNVTESDDLPLRLLRQTLASWRFILLFIAPPMAWTLLTVAPGPARALIALWCGAAGFGCWRLWLDARYFALIDEQNNRRAGEALAEIWQREQLASLSLTQRQQGALRQLRRTMYATAALWLTWLAMLWLS
ncbi:hypothetical protein [Intestinirhabdus alba]|jgi:hypothetical protein|uniref:Uncharacterized protein n=1 Tax=Intestinirhabdus alba TaxID=2899544 RepID=A0A6L6IRS6_9ENTR|nr:hypothetical protein [Intestinirhabdus alba]MTH48925.1 hypothetical protein [Intestinirhabdus alba]